MTQQLAVNLVIVGVTLGAVYALMAIGLTFVYGITKIFNFAQGSFSVWGAYFAWVLLEKAGLPYAVVIPAVIVIMFGIGVALERGVFRPLFRLSNYGMPAIIVSLGTALVMDNLAVVLFTARKKTLPPIIDGSFLINGFSITKHDVLLLVTLSVIIVALVLFLGKARAGLSMRGTTQDMIGAKVVGIRATTVFSHAFAIAAVLAGIAGVFLAPRTMIYPAMGWPLLTKSLVIVVFGGLGSIKGAIIAAFALAVVESFVTYYVGGQWGMPAFLIILIILLVVRPKGLLGKW